MGGRPARPVLVAFLIIVVLAGLNFIGVKYSNAELAPLWGAGVRFAVAGLLFGWWTIATRRAFPEGAALAGAVLYGALAFGASYALLYYGLVDVGPALASVLLALVPLLTFFAAGLQGLERLRWPGLAGGMVAAAGVGVVFRDQLSADVAALPLFAILAGAATIAESSVVVKRFPRADPYATNAVAMLTGTLLLLGASVARGEDHGVPTAGRTWGAVAYLVASTLVIFTLFLYVITHWTASATAYQFVLSPLVTVAVSSSLTGESLRPAFLLGAVLVILGVYAGAFLRPGRKTDAPATGAATAPALR